MSHINILNNQILLRHEISPLKEVLQLKKLKKKFIS